MDKREWGPRQFWLAVAGIAIAAGLGLRALDHPIAGRWLFYSGLILGVLVALGVLSAWATHELAALSNPALRALRRVVRFVVGAVAWLGALLFGPIIWRVL